MRTNDLYGQLLISVGTHRLSDNDLEVWLSVMIPQFQHRIILTYKISVRLVGHVPNSVFGEPPLLDFRWYIE